MTSVKTSVTRLGAPGRPTPTQEGHGAGAQAEETEAASERSKPGPGFPRLRSGAGIGSVDFTAVTTSVKRQSSRGHSGGGLEMELRNQRRPGRGTSCLNQQLFLCPKLLSFPLKPSEAPAVDQL